jgi:sRNA-binding regulator protein Hfq
MHDFDAFGGKNVERWTNFLGSLSDEDFDNFMQALRDKKTRISVVLPNGTSTMTTNTAVELAKKYDVQLFSRVYLHDMHTNRKYLSKYPMMIINLPVRRLSQYLFHKISLPDGDRHINPVTGQVIPPDKGAALSAVETQILASKGLEVSVLELIKIRSGDMNAYNSLKFNIEQTGTASMADLPLQGRPRSTVTAGRLLHGLMIDSNF